MTADRSAAADTLRDELANSLRRAMYDMPMDELAADEQRAVLDLADALLPDWLRYADARVAAERERTTAEIDAWIARYSDRPLGITERQGFVLDGMRTARDIARGRP